MIIILNDNGMSISHNVGAMSTYLSQLRLNPRYVHLKRDIKEILRASPDRGQGRADAARGQGALQEFPHPRVYLSRNSASSTWGPIDGHNIESLEHDLALAKEADGPVLLHVITEKGRGYGRPRTSRRRSTAPRLS